MIRDISNRAIQYSNVINLTVGQPDILTPEHIKSASRKAIDDNHTAYTQSQGLRELRVAARNYMLKKFNLSYDAEEEIIVTNGATEAIDIVFRAILKKGDEVILPAPVYPGYVNPINFCGAELVYADTTMNDFVLSAELIESKITSKTKCILLSYPSNPTGCILQREELEKIVKLLEHKDIFIISDEVYSEFTYELKHESIASFEQVKEKSIVINGVSKSHSMTGFRIGFVFAPTYLASEMLKIHQSSNTCACTISQYAAIQALTVGLNDPDEMKREYERRRDYVYERLNELGLDSKKPMGAFYIFPSIKNLKLNMTSYDFVLDLLEKARVAVVPGTAFSEYGEGYIRISYASEMAVLKEALDRMENYLKFTNSNKS